MTENTAVTIIQASCVLSIFTATQLMIGRVSAVTTILAVMDKDIRMLLIVSLSCLSLLIREPSVWNGWLIPVYMMVLSKLYVINT